MAISESGFWSWLRTQLKRPDVDVQRIESPRTGKGIPDLNLCIAGQEVWVELKAAKVNKSDQLVTIGIRPEQANWLAKRARLGSSVWLLVNIPGQSDTMALFDGLRAAQLYYEEGCWTVDQVLRRATAHFPRHRDSIPTLLSYLTCWPACQPTNKQGGINYAE